MHHILFRSTYQRSGEPLPLPTSETRICVIGLWHLGCVYAACLAELGYNVTGTDENLETIHNLNLGKAPLFEPGLDHLIYKGISSGRLTFRTDIESATADAQFIVIAYDTPVDEHDRVDISDVLSVVNRLKDTGARGTLIISSQVPVGTCDLLERELNGSMEVAYLPENLRLGQAIERFMHPDMIVIGSEHEAVTARIKDLLSPITAEVIEMSLRSAEMTKHALNSFLATSISFANEIGNLCDLVGADGLKVAAALKADSRIGHKALLRPGLGFGGGTLARDLRILQALGGKHQYKTPLIDGVLLVNERQNDLIVRKLRRVMGSLDGKIISILGLTYKAGTSTLRRSTAFEIIKRFLDEGAILKAYDPHVAISDGRTLGIKVYADPYSACEGSEALLIMNDLPEFDNLDLIKVRDLMKDPFIFDLQNILDPSKVTATGLRYIALGRGMLREGM